MLFGVCLAVWECITVIIWQKTNKMEFFHCISSGMGFQPTLTLEHIYVLNVYCLVTSSVSILEFVYNGLSHCLYASLYMFGTELECKVSVTA